MDITIKKQKEFPVWWLRLSKILIIASACNTLFCLFGSWAVNAASFGKYDLGGAIIFAMFTAYSFAASLILIIISAIGIVTGILYKYPAKLYTAMFFISLSPVIYFYFIR